MKRLGILTLGDKNIKCIDDKMILQMKLQMHENNIQAIALFSYCEKKLPCTILGDFYD